MIIPGGHAILNSIKK